ncbi:penicillin acylase family protein [Pseudoxanthomonas daejeonensis]|uniref:Penicillin acylase n=1 Tax=Pseudoxanthomonas daejeonensis TaxID=266062 RepID=A0ABQ6Z7T4_9GAMM|nr:penicillin acylase family protein [Pseudoxanthomonas daejeonensis]KAF1694663.1 penicillin acylase [Pseudoxanthomonas daejeonensis]
MLRWIRRLAVLALLLAAATVMVAWWLLRGSLPALDGDLALDAAGLAAPVSIQRDALGVVTIDAGSETDAMRALGFVHAQERYFEMDLMRRSSAGELAQLFGPVAVDVDRERRMHRIRARVTAYMDAVAGERMPQLQAYADGANAGVEALRVRPWPYLLLRQAPRRWEVADSALTGYAMYFDLQDSQNARELGMWKLRQHLPPALYAMLAHDGTEWDAPLFGAARGNALLPDASQVDLRTLPAPDSARPRKLADKGTPGSNNWAVAGALTADGRAIVADDMHLGLRAPNIWFRVRLRYPDGRAPGGRVDVSGFSLPGLPAVVVGSNGHVAWGFTNSYADTADWYPVRPCAGGDASEPAACDAMQEHAETILVAGGDPVNLTVRETTQGPVLHDAQGPTPALALRWVAHQPGALDVGLAEMARAGDLEAALAVAGTAAMPAQNLVVGDRQGRIAWRIIGPLPVRASGCTGSLVSPAMPSPDSPPDPARPSGEAAAPAPGPCAPWPIATGMSPILADPAPHRLWTANARVLDGDALAQAGDGGYALGARAQQIRDSLMSGDRFDEAGLLAIQLDDRAVFLQRWWQLLQDEAKSAHAAPALQDLASAGKTWEGRATVESVGYRLVRAWRLAVHTRIADGLTAPAQVALGDDFTVSDLPQLEGIAWPLLQQRPQHLLPRRYASWDALLEDAAREVRDELAERGPLAERTWGERNTARICHPLANALPAFIKPRLCMPADPLPGDGSMPRVQGPAFGASERMVVSPGHEADGIVHMPGGQSGHPLSPFWGAGHDDWVHGRATPFLPGTPRHTLTLAPASTPD